MCHTPTNIRNLSLALALPVSPSMARRLAIKLFVGFIALFLLGTVIVLSSVSYYLAIDPSAILSELEVPYTPPNVRLNGTGHERIPRILHQTWKTDVLPERWQPVSQTCKDLMPDYDYMLWTDASARQFISEHYPWFLDTFDHYPYNIQRADSIRYFVLHHYGGIYIDLDIGCLRPLDSLLPYPVILPKTIPVGVSNDLMFAEKEHPFLAQTIHNLATFDHNWLINYPTVMFSTGPMFLSAQYAIYTSSHPGSVRILPNYFTHYYGSSWHADDAGFIWFLSGWGKLLMWIGLVIVILGIIRLAWPTGKQRRFRRYDAFPLRASRSGGWHIQLGSWTSDGSSIPSSPDAETVPSSPVDGHIQLPLTYDSSGSSHNRPGPLSAVYQRVRDSVAQFTSSERRYPSRSRGDRQRGGLLFFIPAIFTHNHDADVPPRSPPPPGPPPAYPADKQRYAGDFERAGLSHLIDSNYDDDSSVSSRDSTLFDADSQPGSPNRSRSVSRHR
ncbi:MIPC synthase [Flagelloscypha sp. PMI_526]|nr:MIPC synthase [Flagelloscypha sp. PMI_526]